MEFRIKKKVSSWNWKHRKIKNTENVKKLKIEKRKAKSYEKDFWGVFGDTLTGICWRVERFLLLQAEFEQW